MIRRSLVSPILMLSTVLLTATGCQAEPPASSPSTVDRAAIEQIVHDYILAHPEIIPQAMEVLRDRMTSQAINANRAAIFEDKDAPIAGNPKGDVAIVEFFDYTCGYCKMMTPALQRLLNEDKNLKIIYKEWPIRGDVAEFAAKAALAARAQDKYLAFHNALYAAQGQLSEDRVLAIAAEVGLDVKKLERDMAGRDIAAAIERNRRLAAELNFNGTPSFVINGKLFPGAMSYDALKGQVAAARAAKK
ncbi:MAG: hypothetical protein DCC73_09385 [Proteobacteria bacterium]|nr:MAG: hypothetical protein DCC73_09385 [Pseudomonadota bacterium]